MLKWQVICVKAILDAMYFFFLHLMYLSIEFADNSKCPNEHIWEEEERYDGFAKGIEEQRNKEEIWAKDKTSYVTLVREG